MSSHRGTARSRSRSQVRSKKLNSMEPSQYSLQVLDPKPYSHAESHHVIRFKAPNGPTLVTPEKPKHSTRDQARLAVKKRLESALNDSTNTEGSIKTKSKLKSGPAERRGRDSRARSRSRSKSISRVARMGVKSVRSLSSKRKPKSGDSVCSVNTNKSTKSNKSTRSLKSVGSRVLTKVKSFKRSKSIGGRSVASGSSRRSLNFWRRRKKKRDGTGENFMYVKQTPTPTKKILKKPRNDGNDSILGMNLLCGSFEQVTLCRDFLCGADEDLVGSVEDPNQSLNTSGSYYDPSDPHDPRY
jgi:hypothetical protein